MSPLAARTSRNAAFASAFALVLAGFGGCVVAAAPRPGGAGRQDGDGAKTAPVAKTHGLVVPGMHPRLWFDPAGLARARAWFRKNPFSPRREDRVDQVTRGLLGQDSAMCRSVLDWAMGESKSMRRSGVACDDCRWEGEAIILAYDWCHAHMTPSERASFVAATNAWIDHWRVELWGGPQMPESNYYWGNVRNELLWAITSYEDNAAMAETLLDDVFTKRLAKTFYPDAATGDMRGGIGREGTQYGIYIGAYATVPWTTAWLMGRDLFTESNYWREAAYHLVYSVSPAPTTGSGTGQTASMGYTLFPYSDDEMWLYGNQIGSNAGNFMTAVAMRWPGANVGRHARQWLETTGAPRSPFVKSVDPGGAALAFAGLPLDYYGSGAGMLYGRSAWGPSATTFHLQLKDGPAEGHSHVHWGNWQVWRRGRYLSRETVSYGETIAGYGGNGTVEAALALAHNSLLVDGAGNRHEPWVSGLAKVTRLETQPAYVYAATDLTATSDNPSFVHWEREFVFVRALETLVVLDRIESSSAGATKTFLAHCETAPTTTANGATCTNGNQALVMTTLVPANPTYRVVAEGGKVGQHRIEVGTSPGAARSYILTVLQAKDRSAANLSPSVTEGGNAFVVTLDGVTRLSFQKGMSSTGGSFSHGASTSPLADGVQQMSVTDDGPVWK